MRPLAPARTSVVLALCAGLAVLSGCGGDDEPAASPTASSGVSVSTGSPAPSSPTESASSSPTGRVRVTDELPANFPTADVPLYDAPIVAVSGGESAWSVSVQPEGDIDDLTAAASKLLTDAGFEMKIVVDEPTLKARQFNGGYRIGLSVVSNNDGINMTYVVQRNG